VLANTIERSLLCLNVRERERDRDRDIERNRERDKNRERERGGVLKKMRHFLLTETILEEDFVTLLIKYDYLIKRQKENN
jgi:hypothetical protein